MPLPEPNDGVLGRDSPADETSQPWSGRRNGSQAITQSIGFRGAFPRAEVTVGLFAAQEVASQVTSIRGVTGSNPLRLTS